MPARLGVARRPVRACAVVWAGRAFAFLAARSRTVLEARSNRAGPVGTRAAPCGELGVENVESVGGDPRDVDVVQRPQIAGDDPAVLLERVGRPAPLLHRNPLLGQVAERPPRMRRLQFAKLDFPGVRLVLCVALPCRLDGLGRPSPRAGQGVTPCVDPELPSARRELSNARHRPKTYAMPRVRHAAMSCREKVARLVARRRTGKALDICQGPLSRSFLWHPQRDSNPCRHLERVVS